MPNELGDMSLSDVYDKIISFNDEMSPDWREKEPVFFSNALAGEVGELCNLTKKLAGGGTNKMNFEQIFKEFPGEFADCFAYLILSWENLGFDKSEFIKAIYDKGEVVMNRAMESNMRKLHNHPQMEKELNLDNEHVIVDKKDWKEVIGVV